jgi:hypothetical protein
MTDQADQADGELIVGNAPPVLPVSAARALAKAAEKHGFDVPPAAQASIDAAEADAGDVTRTRTRKPASAGSPAPAPADGEA